MSEFGFGIVGTGKIAGVVADALTKTRNTKLVAVSGRRAETAEKFVKMRQDIDAVQGIAPLLDRSDIHAVYIATPTAAKEDIALAALSAGKHVLIEKPFIDQASFERMYESAAEKKLLIMDATHFVHHPRTSKIAIGTPEKIGTAKSLHTTYYFPHLDRENIRFDPSMEPMGALGIMGWYSMRAIVEYVQPEGPITHIAALAKRDPETSAIISTQGLIAFASGEVSTFDVGYTAGAVLMDLQLLGTTGVISMDDFVMEWSNSWLFKNTTSKTGFTHRAGISTRAESTFVPTPSPMPQEVIMLERFAEVAAYRDTREMDRYAEASLKTQEYLDAIWSALSATRAV